MAPFALPVPGYRIGIHQHASKRRKTADDGGYETSSLSPEPAERPNIPSHLPADSINPLSHSPATLQQLALAGLSPEDQVPSQTHPLFPHKPLPAEAKRRRARGTDGEAESEDERGAARRDREATPRQYSERLRHLGALTAIVHRCLGEGDVARARRAFGLLVRTKDVDIRQAGLWAVGSEILMRDGEMEGQWRRRKGGRNDWPRQYQREVDVGGGEEEEENDDEYEEREKSPEEKGAWRDDSYRDVDGGPLRRWGSAANMEKVRSYFEHLIQQHPHDARRPHLTSALDFWPALFGLEVYNLDAEFRQAMHRLRVAEEEEQELEREERGLEHDEEEEGPKHRAWAARDDVRLQTRVAAELVARHMDRVMENAPFAAHVGMLRLRGNLALFVADLHLPSRLVDVIVDDEERPGVEGLPGRDRGRVVEELLRERAEAAEEQLALTEWTAEQGRARVHFRKLLEGGGEVDEWIRRFVDADEEGGEDDVGVEYGW
ncbi:hypothetical protein GGR54DRAFT_143247 [Hypoxylon sp. NC1633]|nr:hypothetical protein GGR54DRAFT_143247 [Hypoxylon sp. NC1633]